MDNDIQPEKPGKAAWSIIMKTALAFGVLALGTAIWLTGRNSRNQCGCILPITEPGEQDFQKAVQHSARPRLLDLGATQCIPCKKMAPILEELKREYEGKFDVEFVDVWRMPGVADQHGVQAIPTQIFFDASGKELYRHQGFFAKEEILNKWRELGLDLKN